MLLDMLTLPREDGRPSWSIAVTTAVGYLDETTGQMMSGGVLVIAERAGYEIRRAGESVAAVASEIFQEAAQLTNLKHLGDVQLRLA